MEQARLANKPDILMPVRDDVSDPPNEEALGVVQIMSKSFSPWIKFVETICFGAKPQITATVACDTVH
jgi:hypothetical protein